MNVKKDNGREVFDALTRFDNRVSQAEIDMFETCTTALAKDFVEGFLLDDLTPFEQGVLCVGLCTNLVLDSRKFGQATAIAVAMRAAEKVWAGEAE